MVRSTLIPATVALLLLGAPAASAAPVDDAARELRSAAVWLDPAAGRQLDVAAVTAAIGGRPIKIAVLPAGPGVAEVSALPRKLAVDLPGQTIAVIAGRYFYAGSEVLCDGEAGRAASGSIAANEVALDADDNSDLTEALTDFVAAVAAAPTCEGQAGRGDRYASSPGSAVEDDTATVLPLVAAGIGAAALACLLWVLLARRRARAGALSLRAETRALVDRLATEADQTTAGTEADPAETSGTSAPPGATGPGSEAAGALGEARALLLGATTDAQFAAARRAAVRGLRAARDARVAAGGPAGAEIPPLEAEPDGAGSRVPAETDA